MEKKATKQVNDAKIVCTGIELSPDKWEQIYIKFDVTEPGAKKPSRVDLVMPRVVTKIVPDKDTGELVERAINAFENGHFTAHFEKKAARRAVEKFYPGYVEDILLFNRLRSAINSAADHLQLNPEKLDSEILELRDKLEVYDSMSKDQEDVWMMYLGTIRTIHKFGRESGDMI